ncbi:hypothetical protein [Microbacterium dauci]|uniref:Uncharacterized protein n=1 Tax=Microbacterium dauci TaxID=3048008 RepID=A0ABT6ZCD3_9MICO|nr:hypothetical protein [Microbacterium sp. LX3-4]MDJ1113804.1 hypothetical protein [Microbacterium sp. LX3-4]
MTYSIGRSASDSRCCTPADPPLDWIEYTDGAHDEVQKIEQWFSNLTPWARSHELGRIDELMEAAAYGQLEATGDERTPILPIRADPEIYELRHQALTKKLRFYHGEPQELPDALVAVHRHIKTTNSHQEDQVQHAADRYNGGRPTAWETT